MNFLKIKCFVLWEISEWESKQTSKWIDLLIGPPYRPIVFLHKIFWQNKLPKTCYLSVRHTMHCWKTWLACFTDTEKKLTLISQPLAHLMVPNLIWGHPLHAREVFLQVLIFHRCPGYFCTEWFCYCLWVLCKSLCILKYINASVMNEIYGYGRSKVQKHKIEKLDKKNRGWKDRLKSVQQKTFAQRTCAMKSQIHGGHIEKSLLQNKTFLLPSLSCLFCLDNNLKKIGTLEKQLENRSFLCCVVASWLSHCLVWSFICFRDVTVRKTWHWHITPSSIYTGSVMSLWAVLPKHQRIQSRTQN